MAYNLPKRERRTKIVATLGPASSSPQMIRQLFLAGVDVFRLNFSHGSHEDHALRYQYIRELEAAMDYPIAVMADLQGPKLRLGVFAEGAIDISAGHTLILDGDSTPGNKHRVHLPHPEILAALEPGVTVLLDDGKVKLRITGKPQKNIAEAEVVAGTRLSDRKGFNIPDMVLPVSALTAKDRKDLTFALDLGVDWVALSFVQQAEDVAEARKLIQKRAGIIAKLEKPSAIEHLDAIIDLADAAMVARGDLGVEMPAEEVPILQKQIVKACRMAGKPVIVATQMLESMISAPTPTRAEASDVATAVYDGADAVMLSAETASGQFPLEAVSMMDKIARRVERDKGYRKIVDADRPALDHTAADAITAAADQVARTINAAAIATYTTTGSTTLRAVRERPEAPVLALAPTADIARRLVLSYGVHSVLTADASNMADIVEKASQVALSHGYAEAGQRLVITAGVPFGTPGSTNVLRVAWVNEAA
ncbi:MAG: pyruvate kinase [Alphaproteobacteria bacterium]